LHHRCLDVALVLLCLRTCTPHAAHHEHVCCCRLLPGHAPSPHNTSSSRRGFSCSPSSYSTAAPRHCLCLFSVSFVSSRLLVHLLVEFRSYSKQPRSLFLSRSRQQPSWLDLIFSFLNTRDQTQQQISSARQTTTDPPFLLTASIRSNSCSALFFSNFS
jgi:hypothetical protein